MILLWLLNFYVNFWWVFGFDGVMKRFVVENIEFGILKFMRNLKDIVIWDLMIVWEYEEGKLLLLFVFWDSLVDDCISILDVSVCEVDEMWVLMFRFF